MSNETARLSCSLPAIPQKRQKSQASLAPLEQSNSPKLFDSQLKQCTDKTGGLLHPKQSEEKWTHFDDNWTLVAGTCGGRRASQPGRGCDGRVKTMRLSCCGGKTGCVEEMQEANVEGCLRLLHYSAVED